MSFERWKKFVEETARARERQPEAYEAGATKRQPKGSNTAGTSERDKIRNERGRE